MKEGGCFAYRMLAMLTVQVLSSWIMQGIYCCQDNPSLYFIDNHNIKCLEIKSLDQPNPRVHTVVPNIAEGTAVDVDVRNKIAYWSDTQAWTINRKNLTSGEVKIILKENIGEVYSIAVEWESGLIYWTDFLYERIEVANVDGSSRRTLVTQNVKSPIGIAVDPVNGYMVWSDYDYAQPKIMRADLTGENQRVLVNSRLFYGVPLYLIIDYSENRLYWCDIHYAFSFIGSVDLNGQNFKAIKFLRQAYFPFDLAIFQNHLYWADENINGIGWFPFKGSAVNSVTRLDGLSLHTLVGVVVNDSSRQPMATGRHPCAVNNGNCSDLCLLTPGRGRKCACPQGVTLSADEMTCNNASTSTTQSPPLPAIQVRLAGSPVHSQGRVEVRYNGQWGTICDDYWGISEAHVICRMLNYSGAEFALRNAFFGPGRRSSPIWLDTVKCRGDESTVASCRHDGWRQHDCYHSEDASVICWSESAPASKEPTLAPGPHPELEVRLFGGETHNQGRVEILLNGTWGTICDDSWGIEEANVICRMLNFTEGALSTQCCGFYNSYGVAERIWLDDVHCVGDEQSIAACRHGGWGRHNCRHSEDVGVVCKHAPLSTPDQIVRLADGARESEGRVEVFHDGQWGTVCDDHWEIEDANVVCRMLNYSRALRAPSQAFFGRGNGKIWLSNVNCVGNEASILKCRHRGWSINRCDHHEDASVICGKEAANLESKNFILACESGRSIIYHMSLGTGLPEKGVPLALETQKPQAITFDSRKNMAYWTEQSGSIVRAHLNGSSKEVIFTGLSFPSGIAIDDIGQNLYVADRNGIKVSKLDGSYKTTLINLTSAHGITLDIEAGHIYFTSTGINPRILRADMDGGNQVVLANLSSVRGTTVDIALDKVNQRIYYSDERNNLVKYLDLASLMPHSVLSDYPHGPVGLTIFRGTLYWTGGGSQTFGGAIYKADANSFNGSSVYKVVDLLSFPKGLYAHDAAAHQASANHPCSKQNGGCSHLCLIKPGGYSCLCPSEIKEPCQTTSISPLSTGSIVSPLSSKATSVYFSPNPTKNQVLSTVAISSRQNSASFTSNVVPSTFVNVVAPSSSLHRTSVPSISYSPFSTPSVNKKASLLSSKVKSSPSPLAPTLPLFTSSAVMPSSVYAVPNFCSKNHPCKNGGICQADVLSYKCACIGYFIGRDCSIDISSGVVAAVLNIQKNEFNKTALIFIIVERLNILCKDESGSCPISLSGGARRRKRALKMATLRPEDVIVREARQVDENLQVELAVVRIMVDGTAAIISSDNLSHIILELAANISQILGGRLLSVMPKFPALPTKTQNSRKTTETASSTVITTAKTKIPTPQTTSKTGPTSLAPAGPGKAAASREGNNGGVIGGVVVAVLVIVIMVIALAIWYFRVRVTIPYKQNTDAPSARTTAFENPGYDNTAGFETGDGELYDDIPSVVLSPYEDLNEFGAVSNPIYSAIGLQKVSSRDGNPSESDRSRSYKIDSVSQGGKKEEENFRNHTMNSVSLGKADRNQKGKAKQVGSSDQDVKEKAQEGSGIPTETVIQPEAPVLVLEDHEVLGKVSEM